jgi:hypothetical protein
MDEFPDMPEERIELARKIMTLCEEYRNTFRGNKNPPPFIWIENNTTGEFLAYTLGEARHEMKRVLDTI